MARGGSQVKKLLLAVVIVVVASAAVFQGVTAYQTLREIPVMEQWMKGGGPTPADAYAMGYVRFDLQNSPYAMDRRGIKYWLHYFRIVNGMSKEEMNKPLQARKVFLFPVGTKFTPFQKDKGHYRHVRLNEATVTAKEKTTKTAEVKKPKPVEKKTEPVQPTPPPPPAKDETAAKFTKAGDDVTHLKREVQVLQEQNEALKELLVKAKTEREIVDMKLSMKLSIAEREVNTWQQICYLLVGLFVAAVIALAICCARRK